MDKSKILIGIFLVLAFTTIAFQTLKTHLIQEDEEIFKTIDIQEEELAKFPVDLLINNIKNGRWNLLKEVFNNDTLWENFQKSLNMYSSDGGTNGGIFDKLNFTYSINSVVPIEGKDKRGRYNIELFITPLNKNDDPIKVLFQTEFDKVGKQYFINNIDIKSLERLSLENFPLGIPIPKLSESPCNAVSKSGFVYIKLKNRKSKNSAEEPNKILGENPNIEERIVPNDYYETNAIQQIAFDGIKVGEDSYYPGNVISSKDAQDNGLGDLFRNVYDGDGVLTIKDTKGNIINYPTGFFIDNRVKQVIILSRNNDYLIFGQRKNQTILKNPQAISVVGDFVYVLDRGEAKILILKISLIADTNELNVSEVGFVDFGLDLVGATDLSGFSTETNNILYISNSSRETISRLILDPHTGLVKKGSDNILEFDHYLNFAGEKKPIGAITRLQSSPRNSKTGNNVLFAINGSDKAFSFSTDGFETNSSLSLNYIHIFPVGSVLTNIGYNVGEKAFNITDNNKGKVHLFSSLGSYLGSGGVFGKGEGNNELYYPNVISTNSFADNAKEMIVSSEWGQGTGFKRIFPQADLGKLEVIEKAPQDFTDISGNVLSFRYTVTSGYNVSNIKLKLNGIEIKSINNSFYPEEYSENFLTNESGINGIKDKLKVGWNTFEVELTSKKITSSNTLIPYKKSKSLEFYYLPSNINTNYIIDTHLSSNIVHDKLNNPFYVYKNINVEGSIDFQINNGKIVLLEGCTLKIAKEVIFSSANEIFEFKCGSNLALNVKEDVSKIISNGHFDGLAQNYNMVSCKGVYTGGNGSGNASSSMLQFIQSRFENYIGKALYVEEGRVTVVNCSFDSRLQEKAGNSFLTAAAISLNPTTRLDVRGGEFVNNDIGIDGNSALLNIGHSSKEFNDSKVERPLFKNNKIAVHTYGGISTIKKVDFEENGAAILDLSGTIDISKNNQNQFINNRYAIIFSNILKGEKGKNKFIDNDIDIAYITPPGVNYQYNLEVDCNYWKHGTTEGEPMFLSLPEPKADIINNNEPINFYYIPFAEIKGNNKNENLSCSGGKPSTKAGNMTKIKTTNVKDSLKIHPYHFKFKEIDQLFADPSKKEQGFSKLSDFIKESNEELIFGEYQSQSIMGSYDQAMLKNNMLSYFFLSNIQKQHKDNLDEVNTILKKGDKENDIYIKITKDKLSFLKFIQTGETMAIGGDANNIDLKGNVLFVYPNPSSGVFSLIVDIPQKGNYTLIVFNNSGKKIFTGFANKELEKGKNYYPLDISNQNDGLYYIHLVGTNGEISISKKIIKQ